MPNSYSFVFFSEDAEAAVALAHILEPLGTCYLDQPDTDLLREATAAKLPDVALLDFVPDRERPDKLQKTIEFARELMAAQPRLTCVAVGSATDPRSTLAVLRTGIREFVDTQNTNELVSSLERVLKTPRASAAAPAPEPAPAPPLGGILIQGVRAGVGASTLAVHLASLLHDRLQAGTTRGSSLARDDDDRTALARRVALLDFGVPVADGMMYMNATGPFDVGDALGDIDRLDHTMLRAVMAHDSTYLSVLPLPRARVDVNALRPADMAALYQRLQSVYATVVADVGGWQNAECIAALDQHVTEHWLVTDQSIGALVSLADCLDGIKRMGGSADRLYLVVNRYDSRYGLTERQIAERFNLTLKGTLPDRTLALRQSSNTGRLLHHVARRDPYIKGLQKMMSSLLPQAASTARTLTRSGSWGWLRGAR